MVAATLCIRRYVSGGSGYGVRTRVRLRYALRKGLGTGASAIRGEARAAE